MQYDLMTGLYRVKGFKIHSVETVGEVSHESNDKIVVFSNKIRDQSKGRANFKKLADSQKTVAVVL